MVGVYRADLGEARVHHPGQEASCRRTQFLAPLAVLPGKARRRTLLAVRFELIDRVLEQDGTRIIALKQVSAGEEYLQDHFPTFPVLPGVLMLEAMVQAARRLGAARGRPRLVLASVRAMRFGRFVRPGAALRVEVSLTDEAQLEFKGEARLLEPGASELPVAASGKFSMREILRSPCPCQ
jgi:3-hydroxymyristoyl/3-hydroxydecanoyl-(acyl carrier protein) dehydratase